MAPEVLPLKGELGRMPEVSRTMLTELRAEMDKVDAIEGEGPKKEALKAMRAAMDSDTATRAGVADEFKAKMQELKDNPDLMTQIARAEGALRSDRSLGFEPALATGSSIVAGGITGANKAVEIGTKGVNEIAKMPLVMKIPIISGIIGGGAFVLSRLLKAMGRKETPTLDKIAMWVGLGGVLGTAGVAINESYNKPKTAGAEAPTGDAGVQKEGSPK